MKIIFMGTPDFAVPSLEILLENSYDVVAVVTASDKLGGRGGKHLLESAVKKFAVSRGLPVLQPEKLRSPDFLDQLQSYNADLQVVVAFRMLPEAVWAMPKIGTINLHGSLLPKYRGAAPINWAIIEGERETGVTTFFLRHEIDTGDLLFQEKLPIGEYETAGEVHDRMMLLGGRICARRSAYTVSRVSPLRFRPGLIATSGFFPKARCPEPRSPLRLTPNCWTSVGASTNGRSFAGSRS